MAPECGRRRRVRLAGGPNAQGSERVPNTEKYVAFPGVWFHARVKQVVGSAAASLGTDRARDRQKKNSDSDAFAATRNGSRLRA